MHANICITIGAIQNINLLEAYISIQATRTATGYLWLRDHSPIYPTRAWVENAQSFRNNDYSQWVYYSRVIRKKVIKSHVMQSGYR
jgi:hypothetical protein